MRARLAGLGQAHQSTAMKLEQPAEPPRLSHPVPTRPIQHEPAVHEALRDDDDDVEDEDDALNGACAAGTVGMNNHDKRQSASALQIKRAEAAASASAPSETPMQGVKLEPTAPSETPMQGVKLEPNAPVKQEVVTAAVNTASQAASTAPMPSSRGRADNAQSLQCSGWILVSAHNDPARGYIKSGEPEKAVFTLAQESAVSLPCPRVHQKVFFNAGNKVLGAWEVEPGSSARCIKTRVADDHKLLVRLAGLKLGFVKELLGVAQLQPMHRLEDEFQARRHTARSCCGACVHACTPARIICLSAYVRAPMCMVTRPRSRACVHGCL
eukprot:3275438-Pleurochrysis_carterae.AAC.3